MEINQESGFKILCVKQTRLSSCVDTASIDGGKIRNDEDIKNVKGTLMSRDLVGHGGTKGTSKLDTDQT